MLIIVNGNIASGKSSLCAELHTVLGWPVLAVDDYRRRHNPANTFEGERLAIEQLIRDVQVSDNAIVEITSANGNLERILTAHPGPSMLVLVACSLAECLQRHEQRIANGYIMPPFPWKKTSIQDSIAYLDMAIGLLEHDVILPSLFHTPDAMARLVVANMPTT